MFFADRLGTLFLRFWEKVRPFFVAVLEVTHEKSWNCHGQ